MPPAVPLNPSTQPANRRNHHPTARPMHQTIQTPNQLITPQSGATGMAGPKGAAIR